MRLPRPFIRLPLRVDADALAHEVGALDPGAWRAHPEGAPGNTAVPLIAVGGDPADDSTIGRMQPTPQLADLPYAERVMAALDSVMGRTRLMRIAEEGELAPHVDTNYYWWNHLRLHVPVVTTPAVRFECDGEAVHMAAGEVWVFDTWRRHRVLNPAQSPRIHLVADTVGSAALWELIDDPGRTERLVTPSDDTAELLTETFNHPVVMSPWELDSTLDALLGELVATDPEAARRLEQALVPLRRVWREAWSLHADRESGWRAFASLRDRADTIANAQAGESRLPNGVLTLDALRQLVIRPAVNVTATPAPAPRSVVAPIGPVEIERPIFLVSAPRAGSSLLFETLARAPELYTIGEESHRVIEGIPSLGPAAHDWDSNRLDASQATPDVVVALRQAFVAELRDRVHHHPTGGAVRMLEKTPKNALRVPFLAEAFPDSMFVYLYRDPRETVSSMLDAWRSGRFVTYPDLPGWGEPPWSLLLVPGWRDLVGRPLAEIVATQWATTTTMLLDDLEALAPQRWCVASYDRLVAEPDAEIRHITEFVDVDWDVTLPARLPSSRHTLDSPQPEKWRRNAQELEPEWERVREVAQRAHAVFGAPPRIKPVRSSHRAARSPAVVAPAADDRAVDDQAFKSVHSSAMVQLLEAAASSLLVSTYQSGRLIIVRVADGTLNTHFRSFASPMGIATHGPYLAIGTKNEVQVLHNQPAVAARLEPPGRHDACFVPRRVHTTGDIRVHDLAFADHRLWLVNTRFSCLATLDDSFSFVPQWRPSFVSALAPEDRCHLNGLAVVDEQPRFVTALGATDEPDGWRPDKTTGGVIIDVPSGEIVVDGLCMPHSPRWHDGRLWVLESGRGALGVVDLDQGRVEEVATLPGFTRGLAFVGPYAFVGLSQVREHVFAGLPLDTSEKVCGVWAVDTRTGQTVGMLRFEGAVQEIFEVTLLEGLRYPEVLEPSSDIVDSSFVLPDAALADVPGELRS